jgi:hypothetical protein
VPATNLIDIRSHVEKFLLQIVGAAITYNCLGFLAYFLATQTFMLATKIDYLALILE